MTRTMDSRRAEINQAVWTVLNVRFKKDAKEAFETVKAAGYETYKGGDGNWTVHNPRTNRNIYRADRGRGSYARTYIVHGYGTNQERELTYEEACSKTSKFDFVGCLEKPVNDVWYRMTRGFDFSLTAHVKYGNIQSKERMAQVYEDDIKRTQQEIERLQGRLISYTKSQVQYKMEAQALRKEYGLVK